MSAALRDPWFWAFAGFVGLQLAGLVVVSHGAGRNPLLVTLALTLVTVARLVLPTAYCEQPRLAPAAWQEWGGGALVVAAVLFVLPAVRVRWWRGPEAGMRLHTRGVYGVVRHPIYLMEVAWPLGWSLYNGSLVGLWLTPVWWLGFWVHALLEEQQLERALGEEYRAYARRVRGRILPGLPL